MDTQTYVWFVIESPRLSQRALNAIEKAKTIRLSVASLWEIGIKHGLGKLDVDADLADLVETYPLSQGIAILQISSAHILRAAALPHHHRDPFDRMIVAQALEENLPVVGADPAFDAYGVTRLC